jgi:3-hydroxybutyryl-CoA dehydrogenase
MTTTINTVAVLGTGVLGSQIIMQAAYHGKQVVGYDVSQELLDRLPARWEWMRGFYRKDLPDFDEQRFDHAIASITTATDLATAVADADLVIEAIPEDLGLKRKVWADVGAAAPERTIFATNSSSLRPSDFAAATGRPDRFLALHFANMVWLHNTGEVMRTPQTDDAAFDAVLAFAAEIGLEPIAIRKETPGYLLNSLLIPLLNAAARLYVNGVADPADIDKTWKVATGAPEGPFEIFDVVGFNVAWNISSRSDDPDQRRFAELLKQGIDAGKTGRADGEGFYRYDGNGDVVGPVERWQLSE